MVEFVRARCESCQVLMRLSGLRSLYFRLLPLNWPKAFPLSCLEILEGTCAVVADFRRQCHFRGREKRLEIGQLRP